ncbi:MAG: 2-oxoacid:acceptor oxidoreductase subunit alpha [Candidatus Sumerlaeaceae bacterium]
MTPEASLVDPSNSTGLGAQADTGVTPTYKNPDGKPVINDLVLTIATSNGTGSQSANLILLRTLFNMGVPVGGKNMFPSNIQGLPTWFTIRANKDGWTCRRAGTDVFVAMNPESVRDDLRELRAGSILILNEDMKSFLNRDDLITYVVPFSKLIVPICPDGRLRRLVVNMMYVGVVGWLLSLDIEEIKKSILRQFNNKIKAAELNTTAMVAGYQWAAENLQRQELFKIERMTGATEGKIIIEGNYAAALGLLYGGITVAAWYPITPSSSVCENLINLLGKYRHDADGKATYAVIQAEDELASIGMVVGAGWAGARAATATSGPGISLMSEFAGLSYFAEVPAVIVDVQRMGPSTGLPTRTCQGDILKAYNLSHGDCRHIMLIPGTVEECYEFGMEVLDLAERFQTLVFLMLELDLGMNNWMTDPFKPPTRPLDRGKVLDADALSKVEEFARYRDVDGDGIPYRTLPGTPHPKAGFFSRGTGHTDKATYSEKPEDWQSNMDRLTRKFNTARTAVPKPVIQEVKNAKASIIAYGSSDPAVEEARFRLRDEHKIETDYMRLRALPTSDEAKQFIASREHVYIVEQNRDAQMACVLRAEYPELASRIGSILHYNGIPLDAQTIIDGVLGGLEYQKKSHKDGGQPWLYAPPVFVG